MESDTTCCCGRLRAGGHRRRGAELPVRPSPSLARVRARRLHPASLHGLRARPPARLRAPCLGSRRSAMAEETGIGALFKGTSVVRRSGEAPWQRG